MTDLGSGSLQVDGWRTYTEPSCIMTGNPEGCEAVSIKAFWRQASPDTPRGLLTALCASQVPLRVHDACFTSGTACTSFTWFLLCEEVALC